jgi:hypothetical protein
MSADHQEFSGERLVELLGRQQGLYRQLRLLADRQRSLVTQDDPEPLLALLADRQRLVDGLVDLNMQLAPFRENWSDVYGRLDEPTRKQVAVLLEEVNTSLGAILNSDRRDTATLTAKRESVSNRMADVNAGSRASAAYSVAAQGRSGGGRIDMTDAKA